MKANRMISFSLSMMGIAYLFGFISYKIWQKFNPDYQGWTEGKDTVDVPPDNEYDSKVQAALKRKREQERVDDKEP